MNSMSIGMDTIINQNSGVNHSGLVRAATSIVEASVQTENPQPDRPLLRDLNDNRHCTKAIKSTCAMISSTSGVSNEMLRKIVQIVAKALYGHDLYLTPRDQFVGEDPDDGT